MNMKRNFIFLCFVFNVLCVSAYCNKSSVELTYDNTTIIRHGHPHAIPVVQEDGDEVTIKCDSTLLDVDIVIRDQYGNIMNQSTQTIGPDEIRIYVPNTDVDCEKTTIDLYYDRKHLSGYFNE